MSKGKMKIGLNVSTDRVTGGKPDLKLVTDDCKLIDFAVCHFEGRNYTLDESIEQAQLLTEYFEKRDTDFITNFEYANWAEDCTAKDGCRWSYDGEGCHRLALPEKFLKKLSASPFFKGIMYDEFEHMILNRNPTIQIITKFRKILPAFPIPKTKNPLKQGEQLVKQLKEYVSGFKANGAPAVFGEHVYPVLFHLFAKSGITPNYKSLKENVSNVAFAMAAGAALEYHTPLYNCIDNWYMLTNPGHSADEMYYNLLFAYKAGVDFAYVEGISVMTENDKGEKLTAHGEAFKKFCREYKDKQREYSIEDFRPEIAVIHYDDSFWGQWYPILFKKALLSNPKIKPDYKSRELFRIFNLITHGETCKNGLSWARYSPWALRKHFSFVSMNSAAVFDDEVDYDTLKTVKLCFLCGISISEKTLAAVGKCVCENGITAVTPVRYAPDYIKKSAHGLISEISDGNGKWIVVKSYRVPGIKKHIDSFIGNKGEMRLTFTNTETVMKITDKGNGFETIGNL